MKTKEKRRSEENERLSFNEKKEEKASVRTAIEDGP